MDFVYVLDKEEINQYFIKNREEFFLYFGFLPMVGFFLFYIVFRKYITIPLEKLRQLAYYNNKIPKAFKIRELESIRHSMVDSFSRLENEKKEFFLMARTDSLSGLANRNSLQEFLDRLIPTAKRKKEEFAFLFLDLDHFKTINDYLGHNIGDELLQKISGILKKVLRPNDFIARVGGDEFVLIIQDYKSNLELTNIIKRVHKNTKEDFHESHLHPRGTKGNWQHDQSPRLYREPAQQQVYGLYRAEGYYRQTADHGGKGRSPRSGGYHRSAHPGFRHHCHRQGGGERLRQDGRRGDDPREHRDREHRQRSAHRPQGDRSHQEKEGCGALQHRPAHRLPLDRPAHRREPAHVQGTELLCERHAQVPAGP